MSVDELLAYSEDELEQFVLFRGTFANELPRRLRCPLVRAVLIRDPIERALSQHLMNTRLSGNSQPTPLLEAIQDPNWAPIFSNYLARYLVLDLSDEVANWSPPFDPPAHRIEQARLDYFPLPERTLLTEALDNLLSFDIVGTTNQVYECYQQICLIMGWEGRVPDRFRNTGNSQHALALLRELSHSDFDALLMQNSVDIYLYNVAQYLVRTRTVPSLVL